jgi:DnaJ-domain-containing protein 1
VPDLNGLKVSISERQFGCAQGGPVNLSLTELRGAGLDQATLTEANLTGAVLIGADLSDARLEKADLSGANLRKANLAYATLTDARLAGANLCGADLHSASGLTQAQIEQAQGDYRTALPPHLAIPEAWLTQKPAPLSDDKRASPYALLGVKPGASQQEIRAAWLKLVKELHPDGSGGQRSATEKLKEINQAYQKLKNNRQPTQPSSSRGFFHSPSAVFLVFLLLQIVAAALIGGGLYQLAPAHVSIDERGPEDATSIDKGEHGPQSAPPSNLRVPSNEPWANEPVLGADSRLR